MVELILSAALAVATPVMGAQAPGQPPPRDTRAPAKATAVVRGRVLAAQGKVPLRRARMALRSTVLEKDRLTTTDQDGRYEFTDLPAGRYRLTATKGAYVSADYGQRRAGGPGTSIELSEGQIEKADILMWRGAVIAGQVVDDLGEPAASVRVGALRRVYQDGRPRLLPAGKVVETNDSGQYRLFGLPAGTYYLGASGSVWTVGPGQSAESATSAPTYFPGTMTVGEAQSISIAGGEDRQGVDIFLLPVHPARVTGTALDSRGRPAEWVRLLPMDSIGGVAATGGIGPSHSVNPDGTFVINNVAPGEYLIAASGRNATGDVETVGQRIHVVGEELGGVTLITTAGARISGRVVRDTGEAPSFAPSAASIWSEPAGDVILGSAGGMGRVAADWTFEIKGVAGQRLLRVRLPSGWMLKAVTLDERDTTDVPIVIRGGENIEGVRVVVTDRLTEIAGTVTGEDGSPVTDYSVVLFARDGARWSGSSGGPSRFLAMARPDQHGRFSVAGLPVAEYLAVAVDYLDEGESGDPEFLERMRGRATAVTLGDGETKSIALKLKRRDERQ